MVANDVAKVASVPGVMMPGETCVRPRNVMVWPATPVVVTFSDCA